MICSVTCWQSLKPGVIKVADMRVTQTKELRGVVLKALRLNYPERMGDNVLETVLIQSGGQATDLKPILSYHEDKGYINMQPANSPVGVPEYFIRLTAHGLDLLEGTIQDLGVTLA